MAHDFSGIGSSDERGGGAKNHCFYHFLMFSNDLRAFVKFCNFWRIDSQTDVQIVVDSKLSVGF